MKLTISIFFILFVCVYATGQPPLDSICFVTNTSFLDTTLVDTVQVIYYDSKGFETEKHIRFKGDKHLFYFKYEYDKKNLLKTELIYNLDTTISEFQYKNKKLYKVTDFELTNKKRIKTGETLWEYDKRGNVSRVFNPKKWYSNYTKVFKYDSLNKEIEQIRFNQNNEEVYKCNYAYNIQSIDSLLIVLKKENWSETFVTNYNSSNQIIETYKILNGKIVDQNYIQYDEFGRIKNERNKYNIIKYLYKKNKS